MKKYFLMLASAVVALMLFADNASAQLKVGFGYSLGAVTGNIDELENQNLHGFNVGGVYEFDFLEGNWGNFGMQAGLNYEFLNKNFSKQKSEGQTSRTSLNMHNLNLPVLAKYGFDFIPGTFGAYVAAGPTFSFGLDAQLVETDRGESAGEKINERSVYHLYSGKMKYNGTDGSGMETRPSLLGWFDVKLGLAVGFEVLEVLDLRLGYNWGLVNRYTGENLEGADKFKMHTNNFYLTLSYCF